MNADKSGFNDINAIAYNGNLRDQLQVLHEMLGVEVTDIASDATKFGLKYSSDAEEVLLYMSRMASKLTLALSDARKSKEQLTQEEQEDYDRIKSLTDVIGNLQDKLNRVIKFSKQINDLNSQMSEYSMKLGEEIMNAQAKFREVRSGINAYGFLSDNPELARLFEEQRRQEDVDNTPN